jgi:hypothetical protein
VAVTLALDFLLLLLGLGSSQGLTAVLSITVIGFQLSYAIPLLLRVAAGRGGFQAHPDFDLGWASLPLHAALASQHSARPTAAELPCGEGGISFAWGAEMTRAVAVRRAERERGGGALPVGPYVTGTTEPAPAWVRFLRPLDVAPIPAAAFIGATRPALPRHDALFGAHTPGAYSAIFCLRVTKWVHLTKGDRGLLLLFRRLFVAK